LKPFSIAGRATSADFFQMFDVPMLFGHGWSEYQREVTSVVVLSKKLNERLFSGRNSVRQSVNLNGAAYEVINVTDAWDPKPRFYDVIGGQNFDEGEDAQQRLGYGASPNLSESNLHSCVMTVGVTMEDQCARSGSASELGAIKARRRQTTATSREQRREPEQWTRPRLAVRKRSGSCRTL
jgi:hypothetical protein